MGEDGGVGVICNVLCGWKAGEGEADGRLAPIGEAWVSVGGARVLREA